MEKDTAGNTFVTLRFKLADQMGAMSFWADNGGDGAFSAVEAAQMQVDSASNTADWRFQVPSETSNIRVSMYVTPMGRDVVYFTQLTGLVEGNIDAVPFVQTVTPGEEAAEPTVAAEPTGFRIRRACCFQHIGRGRAPDRRRGERGREGVQRRWPGDHRGPGSIRTA